MEPETSGEPVQEEAAAAKNFFARLGGVYSSPREAFMEIGRAPRLVVPLIALLLISAFSGWYLLRKIDMSAARQAQMERLVRSGRITETQMKQMLEDGNAASADGTGASMAVMGIVGGSAASLMFCLLIAGYGSLFSKMTGAKNGFKNLLEVSIYAMLAVSIVSTVLTVIILQLKGQGRIAVTDTNTIISSSLGTWITSVDGEDVLPAFVLKLSHAVDIFNIWIIALLSIGFSAVSYKLKTASAALWLGGAYVVLYTINAAISAFLGM